MKKPPFPALPEVQVETLKDALKAVLKSLGLTKTQLADKLQIGVRQLDNWLVRPMPDQLDQIVAQLRHLSPEWRDAYGERLRQAMQNTVDAPPDVPSLAKPPPLQARTSEQATPAQLPPLDQPLTDESQRLLGVWLKAPVTSLQSLVMHRYAALRLQRHRQNPKLKRLETFVNLRLLPLNLEESAPPDESAAAVGESRRTPAAEDQSLPESLPDLVTHVEARAAKANDPPRTWLLEGMPGAGKSMLLEALELARAHAWLLQPAPDGSGAQPAIELCVAFNLRRYEVGVSPADPEDWLQQQWTKTHGQAPALAELRAQAKLRLLLDGLNEIVAEQPQQRKKAVQAFGAWAAQADQRGELAPVFTVRKLHNDASLDLGQHLPSYQVEVQPWQADSIRRYCDLRFPGEGNPMWHAIQQDARRAQLIELLGNPFNLDLQCTLFARRQRRLAKNRAQLMGGIALLRLKDALADDRERLLAQGLLADGDDSVILRAERANPVPSLHELALETPFFRLLEMLAFDLHGRGQGATVPFAVAQCQALAGPQAGLVQPVLTAAADLMLMQCLGLDTRRGPYEFSHQLWQEYFAACHLARGHATWPSVAVGQPAELPADAPAWQALPPMPLSPWDECAQLAVQMAPDPAPLVRQLMADNPGLAGRAAAWRIGDLPAPLLDELRRQLLADSTHAAHPLAMRVHAGEALGWLGDNIRYTRLPVRSDRPEVLLPQWVVLAPGHYTVGGWADDDDAANTAEITIGPDVRIGFAPVTNAEFRCFLEAQGAFKGYGQADAQSPPGWWRGGAAHAWWAGRSSNDGRKAAFEEGRKLFQQDRVAFLAAFQNRGVTPAQIIEIEAVFNQKDEAFAATLNQMLKPGEKHRQPGFWQSLRFGNPLQPVVGVSVYEAEAYCQWLQQHWGQHQVPPFQVRLPTEAEWEVAARGAGRRLWPWPPDDAPDDHHFNHLGSRLQGSSPVGCFPTGATPEGAQDMAGNVWEWTASAHTSGGWVQSQVQQQADEDDENLWRAVRGGSWVVTAVSCRPAFRGRFLPAYRNHDLGFRLLCCPIQDS